MSVKILIGFLVQKIRQSPQTPSDPEKMLLTADCADAADKFRFWIFSHPRYPRNPRLKIWFFGMISASCGENCGSVIDESYYRVRVLPI